MSFVFDLRAKHKDEESINYKIDDSFFTSIDNSLIKGGFFDASVKINMRCDGFDINLTIKGNAVIECNRCLEDMEQVIDANDTLKVRIGKEYEETDQYLFIPEDETEFDLRPFIYDTIVLNIPIVHVHPEGECNEEMTKKLNEHLVKDNEY